MTSPEHINPNPSDQKLHQTDALPELEVLARSLDMIPEQSRLGRYMAEPATVIVGDRAQDADYSHLDETKMETVSAIDTFNQGKIGRIRIMGGMVNADYLAHSGIATKNLRPAFEDLSGLNITESSSFHSLFSRGGQPIGQLEIEVAGSEESEANARLLAQGAAKISEGSSSVMFAEHDGKPSTKMLGMIDPTTGERLKNTFLLIKSGVYSDKDGSASHFSNMAFANIVLIPDEMIEATKAPEALNPATMKAVHDGLRNRRDSRLSLKKDRPSVEEYIDRSPVVERHLPDGRKEQLTHMMFVGDSVLGVTNTLDENHKIVASRLAVLPLGAQGALANGQPNTSPRTLLEFDPEKAKQVRPEGYVQDWEKIEVTRESVRGDEGVGDMRMSRNHLNFIVDASGRILIEDNSTNGTEIMDDITVMSGIDGIGFDEASRPAAIELVEYLQANPSIWSGEAEDKQAALR